ALEIKYVITNNINPIPNSAPTAYTSKSNTFSNPLKNPFTNNNIGLKTNEIVVTINETTILKTKINDTKITKKLNIIKPITAKIAFQTSPTSLLSAAFATAAVAFISLAKVLGSPSSFEIFASVLPSFNPL